MYIQSSAKLNIANFGKQKALKEFLQLIVRVVGCDLTKKSLKVAVPEWLKLMLNGRRI